MSVPRAESRFQMAGSPRITSVRQRREERSFFRKTEPCDKKLEGGFTITELLTVIGIIGLLVSMVLPGLKAIRDKGRGVQCMSNLRQIGLAIAAYTNENNGSLPYPWDPSVSGTRNQWPFLIYPYVNNGKQASSDWTVFQASLTGVLACPSPVTPTTDSLYKTWASYKMSSRLRREPSWEAANISQVLNPATALMLADGGYYNSARFGVSDWASTQANLSLAIFFPHGKLANCLFVDGHVTALGANQLEKDWNEYFSPINK